MSALSAICDYFSSDSEEDTESIVKKPSSNKLPRADLSKVSVIEFSEEITDDPGQHEGRIRSFPHVRGNWASFVYITYHESSSILELISKISSLLSPIGSLKCCENLHVSLSRTVVLRFHWINTFIETLQTSLQHIESFNLEFDSVKVYCNEEKSRTFIALQVKQHNQEQLVRVTDVIDKILDGFNLPKFYEEPSYHMSILWIEGDKQNQITKLVGDISEIISHNLNISVNKLHCNIGNKSYQFLLG